MVAVVLRALIDFCQSGKCGLFGKGGLIMFDVTADYVTYHLIDLPPVITLGVFGGILGSLYNFFLDKVLRLYNLINEYVPMLPQFKLSQLVRFKLNTMHALFYCSFNNLTMSPLLLYYISFENQCK
jgi:H+/Cl- antiporter ClcA